ncbi:uncharacterized protein ATC70_008971 [Mucor velutinosus]|uniref:C2H2-type domain-containing protein n=1 Tax=Mucor velutinosus TaxID=708070 RepID=A0AAN7HP90_9FUNG|nr:hypothetical protein ATC70_008971 [Mucor velutinosus]
MDAQVEVVSSLSSSSAAAAIYRKNNNNSTLAVFSSLENINTNTNAMSQKLHSILPPKRRSISQDPKDKFYAIHHTQHTDENDNENSEPISAATKVKKTNRGRKRMGDKTTADGVAAAAAASSSSSSSSMQQQLIKQQRKKPRQQSKSRKDQHSIPSLYQTCVGLWPKSSTLDDLAYDQVKAMSDLLKVRLCQAKFKMMARLDQDNELFTFLSNEYVPPKPTARQPVQLVSRKRQNKSTMCLVGNGKNLFARNNKFNKPDQAGPSSTGPAAVHALNETYDTTALGGGSITTSPQRPKNQKERKRKTPKSATPKQKRVTTPKRRSAAADVVPVTLSDGSSFYVCEPCNKKYKNRNGLAYHMERCKYTDKSKLPSHQPPLQQQQEQDPQSQPESTSHHAVCCQQQQLEHATLIQCDTCHSHLHADCVGLSDDVLEESFYCPTCKANRYHVSEASQVGKDLLQCLLEAQASDRDQQQQQQQQMAMRQDHFDQIQEFLNHQTPSQQQQQQDTQEEDELLSVLTNQGEEQSSQLHIWDDFNASFDKNNTGEQWSLLEDDEPFSNYDTDIPSSAWNMSDIGMFGQPPSLLFSDNTVNTNDDANAPLMSDLSTSMPLNDMSSTTPIACGGPTPLGDVSTPSGISSNANTPIQTADGLWFQFANFEDDYQCEN